MSNITPNCISNGIIAAPSEPADEGNLPAWKTKKRIVVPDGMSDEEFLEEVQSVIRGRRNEVLGQRPEGWAYRVNTLNTLAAVVDAVLPSFRGSEKP